MSFISFSLVILFLLIYANILRTPLSMFEQCFLRRFFAPAPTSGAYIVPNIEFQQMCSYTFLFVSFMRTLCAFHFVCLNKVLFWSLFTLEVQIISNIEFHQFIFHFSNVSHSCDHFAHPTLNVWAMYFTSIFCASPNFSGPHWSQYWVSSNVLIWFFVCFFHANTLRTPLCVFE